MSLSEHVKTVPAPPWRRIKTSLTARLKHLLGIHSYVPTLRTEYQDGLLVSARIVEECWACDATPGE